VNAQTWTTESANGTCAYVYAYLQVDCHLVFPYGPTLTFHRKGLFVSLGATGSLGGQATFSVDPNSLRGASGITFQATGLSIGGGGFQITWYRDDTFIGHGEFYGAGVQLGAPGGGGGSFS
jgi:hypothetical protein